MATTQRPGLAFYALVFAATVLTFAVHEGGHWAAAEALGHDAYYGLNSAGARSSDIPAAHVLLILAGGPAVTVLQALAAFALVMTRGGTGAYAFLFSAAFMRFMAAVMSLFNPNDEARMGMMLGWGQWTPPLLVFAGLAALAVVASRRLGLGWKVNLGAWATATVGVSAVVGLDTVLRF